MTNVESMDYTHSHPSTIASLYITVQFSSESCTHYLPPQNSHHTYLLWNFHSHSEIYCHATFHHSVYYDTLHHCYLALHDHVVDIVFVAKPLFIILSYMSLMSHCTSQYTTGHSYRVISCSKY